MCNSCTFRFHMERRLEEVSLICVTEFVEIRYVYIDCILISVVFAQFFVCLSLYVPDLSLSLSLSLSLLSLSLSPLCLPVSPPPLSLSSPVCLPACPPLLSLSLSVYPSVPIPFSLGLQGKLTASMSISYNGVNIGNCDIETCKAWKQLMLFCIASLLTF